MSHSCGASVPSYEERLALGVKHVPVHPNFERYDDLMEYEEYVYSGSERVGTVRDHIGKKIILPDSTPKDHWFDGEQFTFSPATRNTVWMVKEKAPGLHVVTYPFHGRQAGSYEQWKRGAWGFDMALSRFHEKCNAAEEAAGDRLTYWMVRPEVWRWLGMNYLIWWNWMIESPETGWFWYEPYREDYTQGDPNIVTSQHKDHAHGQRDNPHVAGNN